jgi:hypothetical protein
VKLLCLLVALFQAVAFSQAARQIYKIDFDELFLHGGAEQASIRMGTNPLSESIALRVVVGQQGEVVSAIALSGPRALFRQAVLAEKRIHFTPFLRNGKPVTATFTDKVAVYPAERWLTPRIPFPTVRPGSAVSFRMERRAFCFEPRCMESAIAISKDRKVEVTRGSFAFKHPTHSSGQISVENYQALLDEFRRADFFSMQASYIDENWTDGRGFILTIQIDGTEKTVSEYNGILAGAPNTLKHLEDRFDQVTQTHQANTR